MPTKLQTVHVRIADAADGKPTPVRIRLADANGVYYAPFGRLTSFPTTPGTGVGGNVMVDGVPWAYIDGACEIDLPPGEIRVQVAKGPEYKAIDQPMSLIAGRLSIRLTIERADDLRAEGWHAGDIHAEHLSPAAALLEGQAEGLGVVNLLARPFSLASGDPWLSNILEFSGQALAVAEGGCLVAVNTFNRSLLGDLLLLHCHRIVYPLEFDKVHWTLSDWCGQCHRKGGLVVWSGFDGRRHDEDYVSEGLANVVLGQVDALSCANPLALVDEEAVTDWYHLLNCGLRIPLVAGSGKDSNAVRLGAFRTYAALGPGQELTYKGWIEAVRRGRTFITNGPLLRFAVEGVEAGGDVETRSQDKVKVSARAWGRDPLERLQIISAGEVIAETTGPKEELRLEMEASLPESTWLAARCVGPASAGGIRSAAHTAPVFMRVDGRPLSPLRSSPTRVAQWLGRYRAMMDDLDAGNAFVSAQDRARLAKVFDDAMTELAKRSC